MKALVHFALEKNAVELRDVPQPVCKPDGALVHVKAVGVCGSDLHQRANDQSWPVNIPVILGHEFCGEIVETGPRVEGFAVGDRVVCETAAHVCGTCIYCRSGDYPLCKSRKGFGYGTDGAMTETVSVPERILHALLRPRGTIVKVGWGPQPMNYSLDPLVQKAGSIRTSFSHNYPIWERVIKTMQTGLLDVKPLVRHTYALDDWEQAFNEMERGDHIKSILLPNDERTP